MEKGIFALLVTCLSFFPSIILSQQWDLRGQLTSSTILHNAPIAGEIEVDQSVRYIPTFSVYPEYQYISRLDLEVAYSYQVEFDGLFNIAEDNIADIHRLWARYSSDNIDLRYGIQKIAFGPGSILRPLRWFDTLDEKDPTGQTEGVRAIRLKYFGRKGITYWGWMIHPEDKDRSSRGGRIEIPLIRLGDLGASYHHRPAYAGGKIPSRSGIPLVYPTSSEDRYSLDFRADVIIGLWSEFLIAKSYDDKFIVPFDRKTYMIGGDYTFPVGSGIYFLAEHMIDKVIPKIASGDIQRKISAIMVNYPIGVLDNITYIAEYDWDEKRSFNFIKYSRIYDNYDFNLIVALNPERNDFSAEELELLNISQFGTALQILIIYNH